MTFVIYTRYSENWYMTSHQSPFASRFHTLDMFLWNCDSFPRMVGYARKLTFKG